MSKRKPKPWSEGLRQAIKRSGLNASQIARATRGQVDYTSVYRFLRGERGLSMKALDAVAEVVGPDVMKQAAG